MINRVTDSALSTESSTRINCEKNVGKVNRLVRYMKVQDTNTLKGKKKPSCKISELITYSLPLTAFLQFAGNNQPSGIVAITAGDQQAGPA